MADMLTAKNDFSSAHRRAALESIFSTFRWKHPDLLSFYEVTKLIRPQAETYLGMKVIEVDKIIGSESRYHEFSSSFLPKNWSLQQRWASIDCARMDDVVLPPISVYKLGEWYFVRDGNHRVSVARAMGQAFIDAEVVELSSKIPLEEGMTLNGLRKRVVTYERARFMEQYEPSYLPMEKIVFTAPGAYPEMVHHIMVHKYYINQGSEREISFREGAESWYRNVYSPLVSVIEKEKLLSLFPGSTEADVYMLLVRKWDELKRVNALTAVDEAAKAVKEENRKGYLRKWFVHCMEALSRK